MLKLLLVNPNRAERSMLAERLRKEPSFTILESECSAAAQGILRAQTPELALVDLAVEPKQGLELLRLIVENHPQTLPLAGIPQQERKLICDILKLGVAFYLITPYNPEEVVLTLAQAQRFREQPQAQKPSAASPQVAQSIIGRSAAMRELMELARRIAEDDAGNVLILGESGTGKELVAKAIHALSPRAARHFVAINCAAIPGELLESELFGYTRGAFTGALHNRMGRIQYADGGTLFLDEIGDMKPCLQSKLLRVLQERCFEPVGGLKPIPVDLRVLAATHQDLEKEVEAGRFREDLFYRLSVIPINIPPLRERREDIPLLIRFFLDHFNRGKAKPLKGFTPEAMMALVSHPWPGNVRELENLIQRLVVLEGGREIGLERLPEKYASHWRDNAPAMDPLREVPPELSLYLLGDNMDFNALVSEFEDRLILQALLKTGGNKKEAAQLLKLKRTTLLEKIKKKQIPEPTSLCH